MKRIVLLLVIACTVLSFSSSNKNNIFNIFKPKREKAPVLKVYEGEYTRASNSFDFKKDNLVLPDKKVVLQVSDVEGSIETLYDFLRSDYLVQDDQKIKVEVIGIMKDDVLEVYRVTNYTVPAENRKGRENYILFGQ